MSVGSTYPSSIISAFAGTSKSTVLRFTVLIPIFLDIIMMCTAFVFLPVHQCVSTIYYLHPVYSKVSYTRLRMFCSNQSKCDEPASIFWPCFKNRNFIKCGRFFYYFCDRTAFLQFGCNVCHL